MLGAERWELPPELPDPASDSTGRALNTPFLSLFSSLSLFPQHKSPLRSSYVIKTCPALTWRGTLRVSSPPLGAAPPHTHSRPPRQLLESLQSPRESARASQHPRFSGGGGGKSCSLPERQHLNLRGAPRARSSRGGVCTGIGAGHPDRTGTGPLKVHPEITLRTFLPAP